MTLPELYQRIDGSYDQALRVMRMDKLIDKYIRKYPDSGMAEAVLEAEDSSALFEAAHAMKGVCANLGLTALAEDASLLTEEFRPGGVRQLSDGEVQEILDRIEQQHQKAVDGIRLYQA